MQFSEYCTPFRGDFQEEAQRRFREHRQEYLQLRESIQSYSRLRPHEPHRKALERFYDLSVETKLRDLLCKTDPHASWVAEEVSKRIEGTKVVDVGCCDGFFTLFYVLNHPEAQFTGIDLSMKALDAAKEKAQELRCANNTRWFWGEIQGPTIREEMKDANTIILQDVLEQMYGSNNPNKEKAALRFVYPFQPAEGVVVIAQEGQALQEVEFAEYHRTSYRRETLFHRQLEAKVTYEVAVLKKKV